MRARSSAKASPPRGSVAFSAEIALSNARIARRPSSQAVISMSSPIESSALAWSSWTALRPLVREACARSFNIISAVDLSPCFSQTCSSLRSLTQCSLSPPEAPTAALARSRSMDAIHLRASEAADD
eukprot:scaffold176917_cov33-Tisochrysis_lutea.AAC.1